MAKGNFRGGYGGQAANGMKQQNNMMKQAQKMQEELMKAQAEIEAATFTATAGGGVVTATVTGTHELKEIVIDPDAVDPDDVDMLQDLIIAAVNEAMRQIETATNSSMSKFSGGMKGFGI